MKKIVSIVFVMIVSFSYAYSQKNMRISMNLKPGKYLFNTKDLYFFDDGIDCYLHQRCNDIDTVFEHMAQNVVVTRDTAIKYKAYLFTDNYEYVYTKIKGEEGWMRVDLPLTDKQKEFLKSFLKSSDYQMFSCYVEVMPFKHMQKVFISSQDDWYIGNLNTLKANFIGTKGGRLEACQMNFTKNCVKCYIDLGWGEKVWFDENGKKIKVKRH